MTIPTGSSVLFDRAPTVPLGSITLSQNSRLIFNNTEMDIRIRWIVVARGASFIMGSENCPIDRRITITFVNARSNDGTSAIPNDPSDGVSLGNNGIGVYDGGHISIFGKAMLPSWTRLEAPVRFNGTELRLEDTVTWQPGDELVVTSTTRYAKVIPSGSSTANQTFVSTLDSSAKFDGMISGTDRRLMETVLSVNTTLKQRASNP